jgi:hypothetical protein
VARAVITIWTENIVKSDWVRAEAGRAKADGKLIPVKTPDVAYADIPLPFGEMHTENVESTDLIRAAIVGQLAKPTEPQSAVKQITGLFKYQVLTWIGVIGTVMTIFSNLNGVLTMAGWANDLVDRWHELIHAIWLWVFAWVDISLPKEMEAQWSFLMFCYIMVIGLNLNMWWRGKAFDRVRQAPTLAEVSTLREPAVGSDRGAWRQKLISWWKRRKKYDEDPKAKKRNRDYMVGSAVVVPLAFYGTFVLSKIFNFNATLVAPISGPLLTLVYLLYVRPSEERPWIFTASLFLMIIGGVLIIVPGGNAEVMMFAGYWLPVGLLLVIFLSPLQQLTRSLGFVVLGVVTLLALSEISKLNLRPYLQPPKVSENLVR